MHKGGRRCAQHGTIQQFSYNFIHQYHKMVVKERTDIPLVGGVRWLHTSAEKRLNARMMLKRRAADSSLLINNNRTGKQFSDSLESLVSASAAVRHAVALLRLPICHE